MGFGATIPSGHGYVPPDDVLLAAANVVGYTTRADKALRLAFDAGPWVHVKPGYLDKARELLEREGLAA